MQLSTNKYVIYNIGYTEVCMCVLMNLCIENKLCAFITLGVCVSTYIAVVMCVYIQCGGGYVLLT